MMLNIISANMTEAAFKFFAVACFGMSMLFAITCCADHMLEPDAQDWHKSLIIAAVLACVSALCVAAMVIERRLCPENNIAIREATETTPLSVNKTTLPV
jgi:hypothetical protein